MDWQLTIVVVIVALALCYLGRGMIRAWRGQRAGCGGCGKHSHTATILKVNPPSSTLIPVEQVRLRRR